MPQERHGDPQPRYASQKEVKLAIMELREAFPGVNAVTTDPDALRTYGFSENSYHPASPHSVVVMPSSFSDFVSFAHFV
jgi:D-lactate dehydrogenase (cytochrome)